MKQISWPMLGIAILAAASIMGIGIAIAERSLMGILLCIAGLIFVMGFGFKTKKKLRESGRL